MLYTVKYIGTTEPSLTVNTIYTVVNMADLASAFTLVKSPGVLYTTNAPMSSTANWVIVSIQSPGLVQLYP